MPNTNDASNNRNPNPNGKRRLWRFVPTLVVIALVGIIVLMVDQIQSEGEAIEHRKAADLNQARPPLNVVTLDMIPSPLKARISLPGTVKPWVSLEVVAEVRGKIVDKQVVEGQRVSKGDVLAIIDDRDYRNAHASALASYEAASAAQKRLKALFKDQLATQSQMDDAVAKVKTTRAMMDNAALDLERCVIRSPMSGLVNRILVENGQYMNAADPVAQILQIDRVKVEVGIPESDVDAVRQVERFEITIDALGGRVFKGRCHYLYKTADSLARLYNLEIAVDNDRGEILPDMFTRVTIVKHHVEDGLAVPLYALMQRSQVEGVYVVKNGRAQFQPVTLGIQDGWQIQIAQGLAAGDQVVVVGQRSINGGESVHVTRTVRRMEELAQ